MAAERSSTEATSAPVALRGAPPVAPVGPGAHLPIESTSARIMKRGLDITVSLPAMVVLAPLMVLLLIINIFVTRGNPIFSQIRVGRALRPIRVYKFRSMARNAEQRLLDEPELYERYVANGFKLPERDDPRTTGFGRFMRKLSLDELPQLWCVAVGSMSLVGPRPVLTPELERLYGSRSDCYLRTKPGLTGIWQVSGRSAIIGEARVDLDCAYLRNWSFLGDIGILVRTVPAVVLRRGSV